MAQVNLVPNYSFEKYDTCPDGLSYLTPSCDDWFNPISEMYPPPSPQYSPNGWGSSDYYNYCSNNVQSSIPQNFIGFQYPKTGYAYSGFLLIYNDTFYSSKIKEYIEIKTINHLIRNKKYCLEFYYSIAEFNNGSNYLPFLISALISKNIIVRLYDTINNKPKDLLANPQINSILPIFKDTVNWIKVSGTFIANGGEQYLTIGNFQNTSMLQSKDLYVYIDDVKLYYCGPDTTEQETVDSLIVPNVFTPNGDGYNDKFIYKNQEQWEFETIIYNRWEVPVFNNKESQNWDGTFQAKKVSSGVYFYIIKAKAIKTGEIRVYRGTVSVFN